jgi:hypothetical protein
MTQEEEEEDSVAPSYNEALNALATFRAFIDKLFLKALEK